MSVAELWSAKRQNCKERQMARILLKGGVSEWRDQNVGVHCNSNSVNRLMQWFNKQKGKGESQGEQKS